MKFTKLFFIVTFIGILFLASCSNPVSNFAELECKMMTLTKELQDAEDDAEIEEIQKKIDDLQEEAKEIGDIFAEKYKDDEKGELKASIKIMKQLLKCDALDEDGRKMYEEIIKGAEEELKEMK